LAVRTDSLLEVHGLSVSYGAIPAVRDVSLEVGRGEVVVILGANGAGKSTIINAIIGLKRPDAGSIKFDGRELVGTAAHKIHALGIAWVPEGRDLWATLTVLDNLRLGIGKNRDQLDERLEEMFERFPRLRDRQKQLAGSLSGGEQQMVAIARALMSRPRLLVMDEPSLGLAPLVVRAVFSLISEINELGISVLLVEQNARQGLKVAHNAYLLSTGRIVTSGLAEHLLDSPDVQATFLGAG
jgi:branched-chain amino acid transport system ATP-binding protein